MRHDAALLFHAVVIYLFIVTCYPNKNDWGICMKLMKKMKLLLVVAVMLFSVFGVSGDVRAEAGDYNSNDDYGYIEQKDGTVWIRICYKEQMPIIVPSEIDGYDVSGIISIDACGIRREIQIPDCITYISEEFAKEAEVIYANPTSYARQYADSHSIEFRCINHSEVLIDVQGTPATCTTSGLTDGKKCSECGYMVSGYNYIKPLGHEPTHIHVESTCTQEGYEGWFCKRCNLEIGEYGAVITLPKASHTYNEGVITTEPTITSTGVKTYTCTRCGNTMTETIPRLTIPASGVKVTSANDSYKATKTSVSTKTLEYTGTDSNKSSITVPNTVTIDGVTYKVTSIAKNAFKNSKKLKKIVIGSNIKTIDANAFSGCKNLKSITIKSKNVKTIGKNAFKGIKSNAKIKVPVSKVEKYKKLLEGKGLKKTVKICK